MDLLVVYENDYIKAYSAELLQAIDLEQGVLMRTFACIQVVQGSTTILFI